jgi:RNA polymerase sigma-54 factor|tara:strand:+ start:958 stop:2502 length:1545 start_codon:yes stop_codon:yes gene_type:complete
MATQGLQQVQKQTQSLVLAPQLRQSLKILQVPTLELRATILEELQTNPVLEELPGSEVSIEAEKEASQSEEDEMSGDGEPEEIIGDSEQSESLENSPGEDEPGETAEEIGFGEDEFAILREMEEDLREHFAQEYDEGNHSGRNPEAEQKRKFFFDSIVSEISLQEHLLGQLKLADASEGELAAVEYLIGSLDENGFLGSPLPDLSLASELPLKDVQEALSILRSFDPAGIGAHDLQDCLLLQLSLRGQGDSVAATIIRDHFQFLIRRRVPELSRKLSLTTDAVHKAIEEIAELDPAPGRRFAADQNQTVAPDARIEKVGGEWTITLNDEFIPRLRINRAYKDLMAKGKLSPKEKDYIKNQIRSGKFLIGSIEQRQRTIERITRTILDFQGGFFEDGIGSLKPLTMATVAKEIDVHETTVSRAIAHKYLDTPHGLFEFKYFFTPGYEGADGKLVSNTSVKELIAELISEEDDSKPLSDRKIVDVLKERNIKIARRTVAKYREELGILPTNLRRRY